MDSRLSLRDFVTFKHKGEKVVCVSVAHAAFAALADEHADMLLIGDSLGMTLYGMNNTLAVTMQMMRAHTHAVAQVTKRAFLVADMPYASYSDTNNALKNATHLLHCGAQAIKIEVNEYFYPVVKHLIANGVPVMAHIGLKPQFVLQAGGYSVVGRDDATQQALLEQAKKLVDFGCFSLLVEGVIEPLARSISQHCSVPTIGIGASIACDGQIVVAEDMLGLSAYTPKFVKPYASFRKEATVAFRDYAKEVRSLQFPTDKHIYS